MRGTCGSSLPATARVNRASPPCSSASGPRISTRASARCSSARPGTRPGGSAVPRRCRTSAGRRWGQRTELREDAAPRASPASAACFAPTARTLAHPVKLQRPGLTSGCNGGRLWGTVASGVVESRFSTAPSEGSPAPLASRAPMPEEPEVETEKLEREGGPFLRTIALTTAILAAFAAVASLQAGGTANEALVLKTEAARLQAEASDQWAYYQAKGIKAAVQEATLATWQAAGKEAPPGATEKVARYAAEQEKIQEQAREKEAERDRVSTEADHLLHEHHRF